MSVRENRPRWILAAVAAALVVLAAVLVAAGLWARVTLTVHAADVWLFTALRGTDPTTIGPAVFVEVLRDVTAFGSYTAVGIILGTAALVLLLTGYAREAAFLVLTFAAGALATAILKELIARPRPDIVLGAPHVATLSFPSGHAAKAALGYLGLAVVASYLTRRRGVRTIAWIIAVLLTLAVGVSRVLLGVHWPTDVIAGWLLGGGVVLLAVVVERHIGPSGRAREARHRAMRRE